MCSFLWALVFASSAHWVCATSRRDIYAKTTPHDSPIVHVHDLTSKTSDNAVPIKVHPRTTVRDIIQAVNPSIEDRELILVDEDYNALSELDLGWLTDGQKIFVKKRKNKRSGRRMVNVFRNGQADGGVAVMLSHQDTVESVIAETRTTLGVPPLLLDEQPPARLYDEAGMELQDGDIGWLQEGSNLYIVPASRYYVWPNYPVGTKFDVKFPTSPVPGREIELEVLATSPRLFRIRNFLSNEEIDELVETARSNLLPSVTGANADGTHQQRTSTNSWDHSTKSAKALIARAFDLVRVPYHVDLRDAIQVLHYDKYDRYIEHTDWFSTGFRNWNTEELGSTNRYVTVFFYLNDVEAGGHTTFPQAEALPHERYSVTKEQWESLPDVAKSIENCEPGAEGIHIPAKKGDAILFYNQDPAGKLDYAARHAACPVISGEKWAANVWIWSAPRPEMKTKKSSLTLHMTFRNLRDHVVDIIYRAGKGDETYFDSIVPGDEYAVTTYLRHQWVFRHTDTGEEVGVYVGTKGDTEFEIV